MTSPHYQEIADLERDARHAPPPAPQADLTPRRPHWIGWALIAGAAVWIAVFAWVLA